MTASPVNRRLAAILAADVVGYSRMMAEDEDATLRTLGVYRAAIGDKAHGYIRMEKLPSFEDAVSWVQHKAYECYPQCDYVQQHPIVH